GRPPLGVDGYVPLVAASSLPIVAIGDITPADAAGLAGAGVAGVALVRAVMDAPGPAATVREVLSGFAAGRPGWAPAHVPGAQVPGTPLSRWTQGCAGRRGPRVGLARGRGGSEGGWAGGGPGV